MEGELTGTCLRGLVRCTLREGFPPRPRTAAEWMSLVGPL